MDLYFIEKTDKSPLVSLNPNGIMGIEGVSITENGIEFYQPIKTWVDEYCILPNQNTRIDLSLRYMDSGSFGFLIQILERFNMIHESGKSKVSLNWIYEEDDVDMEEYGIDIGRIFNFTVALKVLKTN